MKESQIISVAPARIDAGGPTDVGALLQEGLPEGYIFNAAINPKAVVRITPRNDSVIVINAEDYGTSEQYSSIQDLAKQDNIDLLKAAILHVQPKRGFNFSARTGIPAGSGLGISASVAVAALGGLFSLKDSSFQADSKSLAQEAIKLEVDYLKITGGSQDQYAAAFGGFNALSYTRDGYQHESLNIPPDTIDAMSKRLLVVYSGVSRFSGGILDSIVENYRGGDAVTLESLHDIGKLALEIKRSVVSGELDEFGRLLSRIWKAQSSLHEKITTPETNDIIQIAGNNGSLGGKGLGAGGGGCVLIYSPEERVSQVRNHLAEKYRIIDFSFSQKGIDVQTI